MMPAEETTFAMWLADGTRVEPTSFVSRRREVRDGVTSVRYEGFRAPGSTAGAAERGAASPIAVTVSGDGREVTLTVETSSPVAIARLQFPLVSVPDTQAHDELLMPSGYGDAILDPVKTIQLYGRRQRRPPPLGLTFVDNTADEIIYNCPALAGLQYIVLHNAGRSVYVACYATGKDSMAFRARAAGGQNLVLSVEHYPDTVKDRWQSPPCEVAAFGGGWHAASDHYRARMERRWSAPQRPAWMERDGFHGWVQVPMHIEGQPPRTRFRDIPDAMRRVLDAGHNVMHLYGWMGNGHDTLYPDYLPDPALGTAAELRKALDEVRAMGGRAILYTNGKLIATDSEFHKKHGCECCASDAGGEPWREKYGTTAEFHIGCPGSPRWREHFVGAVRRMVGEYGAHAVQIDQVASTWIQPCWKTAHDHGGTHDNAWTGMETMLREVRDTCRALDPDFFVWAEGCQERLGQFFDIHQGSYSEGPATAFSVTVGRKFAEQFRFTWPRALVMGGASDIPSLCYTFSLGKPFDCAEEAFTDPVFAGLHKDLLRIRREHPRYFERGVYRDSEGVLLAGQGHVHVLAGTCGRLVIVRVPGARMDQSWTAMLACAFPVRGARPVFPATCRVAGRDPVRIESQGPVAVLELEAS